MMSRLVAASILSFALLFSIISSVSAVTSSQLPCGIQTDATGSTKNYDFSSLSTSDITPPFNDGGVSGPTWIYYLHVCGTLTSAPQGCLAMPGNAACQVDQANPASPNDLGVWPTLAPLFTYVPVGATGGFSQGGVTYTIVATQSHCWTKQGRIPYTTVVNLVCANAAAPMSVDNVPGCTKTYTVTTPLACGVAPGTNPPPPSGSTGTNNNNPNNPNNDDGGSSKSGLSGGWIFIIVLICIIPFYIGLGCLYKTQKLGAHGVEGCPNIEFWRDLPSMVKDGCVFTFTKLRSLCGGNGGGSSGGQSYETM